MAIHTAITFLVITAGVWASRPEYGIPGAIRQRVRSRAEGLIYLALAVGLLALLATGASAYFSAKDAQERSAWVDHTNVVRRTLTQLLLAHEDIETATRGYVIAADPEFLRAADDGRAQSDRLFERIAQLVQDNPTQIASLQAVAEARHRHIEWAQRLAAIRRDQGIQSSQREVASGTGRRISGALRTAVDSMDGEEARLLGRRSAEERASVQRVDWTIFFSTLLSLLVVFVAGAVIHRDFGRRQRAEQVIREQNELLEARVRERTAQLQTVLENLLEGVAVFTLDGQVMHFNRAALEVHGYANLEECLRAQSKNPEVLELLRPDETPLARDEQPLSRILRGETLREEEVHVRQREAGWERVFSYGGSLANDDEGNPLMAVVTMRDITERKAAEQRTRRQLEHLNLLDQMTRAIGERQDLKSIFQVLANNLEESLAVDLAMVCLYVPDAAAINVVSIGIRSMALAHALSMDERASIEVDTNGLSRCLKGQLVHEPDIGSSVFPFPRRLASGGLQSLVLAPLRAESQVFGILVVARRKAEGFNSAECEFLRQLSEHVALAAHQANLYESLREAYDELRQTQQSAMQEERLRALGQMASGIAHDINNALSPVALYTESMLETEANLSERGRRYLETIGRSVEDVAQTVARLREFYRQREDQVTLMPMDLNQMVEQVLDLTRPRWSDMPLRSGISIETATVLEGDLPKIMGAESEIREALTNLIFNAVDAMPDGGRLTLSTRLHGDAEHPAVAVEVADSGLGMDEDTRRRCLEPFFTTKGERGTGLGLAMVFGMVKRHSAEIEIDSAPGAGTRIRLIFAQPASISSEPTSYLHVARAPSRLRLLLIDDDPVLMRSLRDTLEVEGHDITTASGGKEGLALFQNSLDSDEPFDAVVTDLGMPHVDGRKVAAAIKKASPAMPVILLTGWGERLVAEDDIPPGVDRVLAKPPKLRQLREGLAQLCGLAAQGAPE